MKPTRVDPMLEEPGIAVRLPGDAPDDEEAIAGLLGAVQLGSPSGSEQKIAVFVRDLAVAWGLDAWVDAVGNVIAKTPTVPGPTLMLMSHLDTVPGVVMAARAGGQVRGRGVVDAKGSLMCMLVAAARFRGRTLNIVFVGAVEEETPGSRGAVHVRETLPCPDALIVGEPSGVHHVTLGYKGKLDLKVTVETERAHPAAPGDKSSELLVGCV